MMVIAVAMLGGGLGAGAGVMLNEWIRRWLGREKPPVVLGLVLVLVGFGVGQVLGAMVASGL